ncbi:MAG TPA: hypothetical protein VN690_09875 [Terriglobales bacterium]|nr:hypothetical protein [Terriglobales bacterium]
MRACVGAALALAALPLLGQRGPLPQGHSIGKATIQGNLIVLTLDPGALGRANLFDLDHRTLRFTPEGAGYQVANLALDWDAGFGDRSTAADVQLEHFAFPFSGRQWSAISVGGTGSIRFGVPESARGRGGRAAPPAGFGGRSGGVALARFAQLQQAAPSIGDTQAALCVFLKPRMSGRRYIKQLADRVVITWDLTEPVGGIQDFSWTPTVNRFQAVLHQDGSIEFSYSEIAARDAIVGVYPKGVVAQAVDFSQLSPGGAPYPAVYEAFHYLKLPSARDLACSIIPALGDKFDMLAYYSDFRVDNQEAGTPSNGPLGTSNGVPVTGIGAPQRGLASYCSPGRFQWGFIQPVYVGANQMQPDPPPDAANPDRRDIMAYRDQFAEIAPDRNPPQYLYAMSQIGHEMGHRWSAFVSAQIGNELIPLGPTHWARGLQAPVPFPYLRPTEASAMGGGVWQDNHDGTFTQLDDDYYVPPTGYSYLDLYLMGLVSPQEVPDFFVLSNLVPSGHDAQGHAIFQADRTPVTIQEVIAAEGPRVPDVMHSQRQFNTGMVMVVEHGRNPSPALVHAVEAIRTHWMAYFSKVTGDRASMTANPR